MANSNEKQLLGYLQSLYSETKKSVDTETENLNFWSNDEYKKYWEFKDTTPHQVQFFIRNANEKLNPLMFRLKWIESQINQITEIL